MATDGILGSKQVVINSPAQTAETPRKKSIPVSTQKSESTWAWTLAKVALVAAAALGVGAALYYTNRPPIVPTSFDQLTYEELRQVKIDLAKVCDTAVKNYCIPSQDGTKKNCVADCLYPNWKAEVQIENMVDVICYVDIKSSCASLIGRGPGKYSTNYNSIITELPKEMKNNSIFEKHQTSLRLNKGQVLFKSPIQVRLDNPSTVQPYQDSWTTSDQIFKSHFDAKNRSLPMTFANVSTDDVQFPIQHDKIGICPLT